jgi:2-polyprenyl-6-methoxyphenol hydroxylase-like FAD-dependent oxidoreductase
VTTGGHDAVVVGARCAGSTLALALAREGMDVLVIDRDELGSDTISTHAFFPNTIARFEELGVLDRMRAGHELRPMLHHVWILGRELEGTFTEIGGWDRSLSPRRVVIDRAIAEAAMDAGAEIRFATKVRGLIGRGADDDPVRGVELDDGTRIEADRVFGADGRASTVAGLLDLEKRERRESDMSMLFAYWRGVGPVERMTIAAREERGFNRIPCEDDIDLLVALGPPEFTRGTAEDRERRYHETIRDFPDVFDASKLDGAEMISGIVVIPETMLRGFFKQAAGPGWALVGDAGHFKHPATAQGISDAVEQALHVANAVTGSDPELAGYEEWRDRRAEGHYDWSFQFGRFPREEVAGPLFDGMRSEPQAEQDFRDTMSRTVNPRHALSQERLDRWFAAVNAPG